MLFSNRLILKIPILVNVLLFSLLCCNGQPPAQQAQQPDLICISPENSTYTTGTILPISWLVLNPNNQTAKVVISLSNLDPTVMPFSQANLEIAENLELLSTNGTNPVNSYQWLISNLLASAGNYRIRVWGKIGPGNFECYSQWFTVSNPLNEPVTKFTVVEPTENHLVPLCSTLSVRWLTPLDNMVPASLFANLYRINRGSQFPLLVYAFPKPVSVRDGGFDWIIPQNMPVSNNNETFYFFTFWKMPVVPSLIPGYQEKYGGNSHTFQIVKQAADSEDDTCPTEDSLKNLNQVPQRKKISKSDNILQSSDAKGSFNAMKDYSLIALLLLLSCLTLSSLF